MVNVKVNYDTEEADKQMAETQASIAAGYEKLGEIGAEAFGKAKDALEGVKDLSESWLPILGEENEELSGLIGNTVKFGEAGSKVFGALGPMGAAFGAIVGGISAFFFLAFENEKKLEEATKAAAEELEKQEEEMRKAAEAARDLAIETENMVDAINDLDKTSLSGVNAALGKTQDEIEKTIAAILKEGTAFTGLMDRYIALKQVQEGNIVEARNTLQTVLGEGANKIDDTLDRSTQSTSDLKEAADKAQGELGKLQKELGRIYQGLDDIKDQAAAEDAVKETVRVLAAIDKQTAAYTNAKDEIKARGERALAEKTKLQEEEQKRDAEFAAGIRRFDEGYEQEQLDANAEFERQLRNSKEAARLQEIEDILAFNAAVIELEKDLAEETTAIAERRAQEDAEAYEKQVEKIKGYLQPFADLMGATFDMIAENVAKGEKPLANFGNALREFLAEELKIYARKWGIQSLGYLAEGIALASGVVTAPLAPAKFAAAAALGAAALAAGGASIIAGAGSQVPAPASSSGDSGASLGGGSSGFNPSLGNRDRGSAAVGGNITVILSDNFFLDGDARSVAKAGHKLAGAIGVSKRDLRLDEGV